MYHRHSRIVNVLIVHSTMWYMLHSPPHREHWHPSLGLCNMYHIIECTRRTLTLSYNGDDTNFQWYIIYTAHSVLINTLLEVQWDLNIHKIQIFWRNVMKWFEYIHKIALLRINTIWPEYFQWKACLWTSMIWPGFTHKRAWLEKYCIIWIYTENTLSLKKYDMTWINRPHITVHL